MERLIDFENDGINMAPEGDLLFIRCKNSMYKYDLTDMSLAAQKDVFKKDGKSRAFSVYGDFIFLYDFCDLYILRKEDLQIVEYVRLGDNLSSDICGIIACDASNVYLSIRNGQICVFNMDTKNADWFDICDSSFWGFCVYHGCIYVGTVKGELIEIDMSSFEVLRRMRLTNKKNIYSIAPYNGMLYTVSLDKTINVVSIENFEVVRKAKNAVGGMEVRILGIYDDCLVIAFQSKISLWNINTLESRKTFDFPTNQWNKGITLDGNRLFGSDHQGIYSRIL